MLNFGEASEVIAYQHKPIEEVHRVTNTIYPIDLNFRSGVIETRNRCETAKALNAHINSNSQKESVPLKDRSRENV
jgi:hypothetical protein